MSSFHASLFGFFVFFHSLSLSLPPFFFSLFSLFFSSVLFSFFSIVCFLLRCC